MNKIAIALCIASVSAVTLESQWGVKDLTDEVVAFQKMDYEDQEKSVINDSIREAEEEAGHKLGQQSTPKKGEMQSTLPEELQPYNLGKNKKFDNGALE